MALAAALREYSGLWFGWSGKTTPAFSGEMDTQLVDGVTTAVIDLEEADLDEYYNGYANKTLWPLFHYRTDLAAYDRAYGEGYRRVNKRFAETLAPLISPDDVIWIHDYHLIPLARELRELGVANRIGFFLHVPWPRVKVHHPAGPPETGRGDVRLRPRRVPDPRISPRPSRNMCCSRPAARGRDRSC